MEKALSFLSRHKDVAFATVEENKPKIRVFQIMKRENSIRSTATWWNRIRWQDGPWAYSIPA